MNQSVLPLRHIVKLAACVGFSIAFIQTAKAEIAVKSGEKIAFLGDSITQGGWSNEMGYVRLVIAGLEANGVKAEPVPAGISGHKSNDMLARLERDVISKKPQWMTLSCGVNDVWHNERGVPLDEAMAASGKYNAEVEKRGTYKKNITEIVNKAQAAGIKVVMTTATVIQENLESPENVKLAPYNEFLRALAKEKKLPLADLNAMFQERIKAENKPGQKVLTADGVHMRTEGNKLMATGILKAFGVDGAQMKKAEAQWAVMEAGAKAAAEAKARADAEAKAKAAEEAKAKADAEKAKQDAIIGK
jgi:lysophospholipase L1-like esterase